MKRGDIYWVRLDNNVGSEIKKSRPCVIVGANPINQARRTLVVVPLSTSAKINPPITVSVSCSGKKVAAVCDQIRTIDKSRIGKSAGTLTAAEMRSVDEALREVLVL